MKKIAVMTDFSDHAFHAAEYALSLAAVLKADLLLYNSFIVPSAQPLSTQVAWPMEDYNEIKSACEANLATLKTKLEANKEKLAEFRPRIECRAAEEIYSMTIDEFLADREVILLIMGNHHKGFSSLMLADHTKEVLNHSTLPVLFIPGKAKFKKPGKIAFATDLDKNDMGVLQSLAGLASYFNAEILLTHICGNTPEHNTAVKDFLNQVGNQIDYPHIYYRQWPGKATESLAGIAEKVQADLLVMVHEHKSFLSRLFSGSHSQKQAAETQLPLLIFPRPAAHLPVF